ncbi:MAG: hypothetical protein IPI77_25085 [Saprospiraceae bacterium]|nr:hypothetical protein [Saprospiraceae bacterium]
MSLNWFKTPKSIYTDIGFFRSNNLLDEFGQITLNTVPDSFHIDSISLDNLSPYIYYKIAAEDISANLSVLSSVIKVARYDTIPSLTTPILSMDSNGKVYRIALVSKLVD